MKQRFVALNRDSLKRVLTAESAQQAKEKKKQQLELEESESETGSGGGAQTKTKRRLQSVLKCCKKPSSRRQKTPEMTPMTTRQQLLTVSVKKKGEDDDDEKPIPNKILEAGKKLPPFMSDNFPKKLIGVPIEDLDEYYEGKKTMLVIGKDMSIFRFSATSAFWLLSPLNPIRRIALRILTQPIFSNFILCAILANCVCMAMQNPPEQAEVTFTVIYTIEALVKMLSRGIILEDLTYLRDAWNWLDVIVLTVAYVMFFDRSLGNVSGLRTLRVLRALKSVTAMPGLRVIITALMEGVKRLRDVTILSFFVLSIFSLIGVQIYRGRLSSKCVLVPEDVNITEIDEWRNNETIGLEWKKNTSNWQISPDGVNFQVCSDTGGRCLDGFVCVGSLPPNPNFGYTSYDNFGAALLCSFRLMTQDFWESLYQLTLRSTSIYNLLFFWFVIFLGSFYLINVILAIVAMAYADCQKADQEQEEEMLRLITEEQACREQEADDLMREAASLLPESMSNLDRTNDGAAASIRVLIEDAAESDGHTRTASASASASAPEPHADPENDLAHDSTQADAERVVDSKPGNGRKRNSESLLSVGDTRFERRSSTRDSLTAGVVAQETKASSSLLAIPAAADAFHAMRAIRSSSIGSINPRDLQQMKSLLSTMRKQSLNGEDGEQDESEAECELEKLKKPLKQVVTETLQKYFCDSWSCPPCWLTIQKVVAFVVLDPFVDMFITLCIVVNTLFLSLDHYGMQEGLDRVLKNGNYFFTATFAIECFAKIIALSPVVYFKDSWNVFDAVVVTFSLVELGLDNVEGLSVLRSFRLLRVFKLAKSWPTLNMLISIIFQTLGALGNLTFVLATIVFIFAVVGQQMFGSNYIKNCKVFHPDCTNETAHNYIPRWNFYDFWHSFMIVFRVLCGEWIESMWDCMRVNDISCLPFFIATMVVGNLVVLKLFLALLLGAFGGDNMKRKDDDDSDANKLQEAIDRVKFAIAWVKIHTKRLIKKRIVPALRKKKVKSREAICAHSVLTASSTNSFRQNGVNGSPAKWVSMSGTNSVCLTDQLSTPGCANKLDNGVEIDCRSIMNVTDSAKTNGNKCVTINNSIFEIDDKAEEEVRQVTLTHEPETSEVELTYWNNPEDCLPASCMAPLSGLFEWLDKTACGKCWWRVRVTAYRIVDHRYFETFIILMIAISSLSLTLEDIYLSEQPTLETTLKIMDKTFNFIFFTEMILKWFAIGFKLYFADAWCWVDFTCVTISLISMGAEAFGDGAGSSMGAFKAMRTLRALRPLRAVSRWEGMRIVVNALFQAIPAIANVMLVCLVFWLIFSIVGVQFFAGQFHRCVDENGVRLDISIVDDKEDCLRMRANGSNVTWFNPDINFDSVANAYLALFQVATFKGWMEIMADATDVRGVDKQPSREHSLHYYIYFVMFIIFGAFFTLNLFIGVIIENFNAQKKKGGNTVDLFMTEQQKRYYRAMKSLTSKAPQKPIPKPKYKIGIMLYELVHNQKFDIAIMLVIMANTVAMCVEHEGMSKELNDVLERLNNFFVFIFLLEFFIKVIALRWHYLKNPWNIFDSSVLAFSLIGMFTGGKWIEEKLMISPTLVRIIRVFRVGRVLRLIKSAKGIRTLLFSLMVSLPALFNIGLLLVMVMFIYSIFGVNFFSRVKLQAGLDDMFNFQTFLKSFVLLFQICTSAGWNGVLVAITNTKDCDPNKDCGNKPVAIAFLVSYLIISFLVIVNMYIAVILENFSIATEDVQAGLTQDDFDMYYEKWEKYDPKATGYIALNDVYDFLDELEPPLKQEKPNRLKLVMLNVPICKGDRINCVDLLDALTRYVLGTADDETSDKIAPKNLGEKVKKDYEVVCTTMSRQRQRVAIAIVIRALRKFKHLKENGLLNGTLASDADQTGEISQELDGDDAIEHSEFVGTHFRDEFLPAVDSTSAACTPVSATRFSTQPNPSA